MKLHKRLALLVVTVTLFSPVTSVNATNTTIDYDQSIMNNISTIDQEKPEILSITISPLSNPTYMTYIVEARDNSNGKLYYSYNQKDYQESNTLIITQNGEYLITVKDEAGNISEPFKITLEALGQVEGDNVIIKDIQQRLSEDKSYCEVTINAVG